MKGITIMGDELLLNFGLDISALIYNFISEITKLPWQPTIRVKMAAKRTLLGILSKIMKIMNLRQNLSSKVFITWSQSRLKINSINNVKTHRSKTDDWERICHP